MTKKLCFSLKVATTITCHGLCNANLAHSLRHASAETWKHCQFLPVCFTSGGRVALASVFVLWLCLRKHGTSSVAAHGCCSVVLLVLHLRYWGVVLLQFRHALSLQSSPALSSHFSSVHLRRRIKEYSRRTGEEEERKRKRRIHCFLILHSKTCKST